MSQLGSNLCNDYSRRLLRRFMKIPSDTVKPTSDGMAK
jgi:hypothetical protein